MSATKMTETGEGSAEGAEAPRKPYPNALHQEAFLVEENAVNIAPDKKANFPGPVIPNEPDDQTMKSLAIAVRTCREATVARIAAERETIAAFEALLAAWKREEEAQRAESIAAFEINQIVGGSYSDRRAIGLTDDEAKTRHMIYAFFNPPPQR